MTDQHQTEAQRLAALLRSRNNNQAGFGLGPVCDEAALELLRLNAVHTDLECVKMQLAACGVVAMADTPDSAKKARTMHPDYESASCDDVKRRVDECIELRARVAELEVQLESIGAGGVGPLMKGTHREQHLDMVPLPRAVVEHVMYHLNRGDDDAVCWADGVIKPALEQPQRKLTARDIADSALLGNIESQFNACMHQEHCKRWKAQADQQHQHKPNWKLVPVEPTIRQMAAMGPAIRACYDMDGVSGNVIDVYRAMLAAAPQPPYGYDQQALDLCPTCGWKTLIPGDCCLNCAQQQPKVEQEPVATVSIEVTGSTTKVDIEWGDLLPQLQAGSYDLYTRPQPQQEPQNEQEPVAWIENVEGGIGYNPYHEAARKLPDGVRFDLYVHPQNLRCKSNQARLAALWGYVKAEQLQGEQEPVARVVGTGHLGGHFDWCKPDSQDDLQPGALLYTRPQPKREPLTESEERQAFEAWCHSAGLMQQSHGIVSISSHTDTAWLAWQAAAAPKPPVNQQLREAAQQALQALQVLCDEYGRQMTAMNHKTPRRAKWTAALSAIAALSQAIEAEQQVSNPVESHQIEPVAVVDFTTEGWRKIVDALRTLPDGAQLYTRPQPAQEPLTDEAKAVIDAARAAMDESTESYNGRGDISIASELAAALSLRLDEYDRAIERAHGIGGEA